MNYVLSAMVFCLAISGCSQTAGGDISTSTEISPTTNFQLNSANGQQSVSSGDSTDNNRDFNSEGQ